MNVDPSVLARLKRLDKRLEVTFSPYSLDPETRGVIEAYDGKPVHDPHYYLWIDCPDGKNRLVGMYTKFDHEEVAKLEGDLARRHNAMEILQLIAGAKDKMRERKVGAWKQQLMDKIAANKRRIEDLVFDGKDGTRQAKPFSAPGVGSRATPGLIQMDPKEDGWETQP